MQIPLYILQAMDEVIAKSDASKFTAELGAEFLERTNTCTSRKALEAKRATTTEIWNRNLVNQSCRVI